MPKYFIFCWDVKYESREMKILVASKMRSFENIDHKQNKYKDNRSVKRLMRKDEVTLNGASVVSP